MEYFIKFMTANPAVATIAIIIFCIGGIVNAVIIMDRKFGIFGEKPPTLKEVLDEVQLTNSNHLSHLPETELAIQRIESYVRHTDSQLEKINDTLIRIEERLKK